MAEQAADPVPKCAMCGQPYPVAGMAEDRSDTSVLVALIAFCLGWGVWNFPIGLGIGIAAGCCVDRYFFFSQRRRLAREGSSVVVSTSERDT